MPSFGDSLPLVARRRYDAVVRERDEWERRARFAAERELAARRYRPPAAPRRSPFALAITGMWLVIVGVVVGGAVIPHHDDRPTLAPSIEFPARRTVASTQPACAGAEAATRQPRAARQSPAISCRLARATSEGFADATSDFTPRRGVDDR